MDAHPLWYFIGNLINPHMEGISSVHGNRWSRRHLADVDNFFVLCSPVRAWRTTVNEAPFAAYLCIYMVYSYITIYNINAYNIITSLVLDALIDAMSYIFTYMYVRWYAVYRFIWRYIAILFLCFGLDTFETNHTTAVPGMFGTI